MRTLGILLALPLAAAFSVPPAPWTAGAGICTVRAGACPGALHLRAQVIGERLWVCTCAAAIAPVHWRHRAGGAALWERCDQVSDVPCSFAVAICRLARAQRAGMMPDFLQGDGATSRRDFLSHAALPAILLAPGVAAADSTGKFTSKVWHSLCTRQRLFTASCIHS